MVTTDFEVALSYDASAKLGVDAMTNNRRPWIRHKSRLHNEERSKVMLPSLVFDHQSFYWSMCHYSSILVSSRICQSEFDWMKMIRASPLDRELWRWFPGKSHSRVWCLHCLNPVTAPTHHKIAPFHTHIHYNTLSFNRHRNNILVI